jgi:hypothetical protein
MLEVLMLEMLLLNRIHLRIVASMLTVAEMVPLLEEREERLAEVALCQMSL